MSKIGATLRTALATCAICSALSEASIAQEMRGSGAPQGEVQASGTVERHATPDAVTVMLQVESRGQTAQEARSANEEALRSVQAALAQVRGASANIVGYRVGVQPRFGPERGDTTRSYSATTIVRVRPARTDDAARIIELGLRAGATGATLRYESSAISRLRNEAIAEAARAARAEAEVLARAMGGSLGALIWTGIDRGAFAGGFAARVVEDPQLPMPPTDITVSVTVTGRWRFMPGTP